MTEQVRNPVFARIYERLSARSEEQGQAENRRELLAGLSGTVVEVGAGNGLNFAHYPPDVVEVIAVEPEPHLRGLAEEAAHSAEVAVRVVDGLADELPLTDGAADAGVASLVLCSVPDQAAALAELRRVIRPGGELRFYEHVAARGPLLATLQRIAGPVWTAVAGGCRLRRDTPAAIRRAGFEIERCRRFAFEPAVLAAPHVLGAARRP